jgi:putative transposase
MKSTQDGDQLTLTLFAILRQAEGGVPVAELCREHGMSDASFYIYGRLPLCK